MRNTLTTIGLAGASVIVLSSFAFMQKSDEVQEPKKNRHVRMVKVVDGKKTAIDTVFTDDKVFVWNGDTINPVKHGEMKHMDIVKHVGKDGKSNVMIFKHPGGKPGEPMIWNMDTEEQMDIITDDDSPEGKKIIIRKHMKDGDADHMMFLNGPDSRPFPPAPPVPPMPGVPHVKMMGIQHGGKVIDLNDPDIISYKKKDMSGGREKIEIIRKKSDNPEHDVFKFNFDPELMAPEAPDAPFPPVPDMEWQSDDDSTHVRIIEHKKVIDGKDGKEVEVKIEKKENK